MEKKISRTNESWIYGGIFALAVAARFLKLGAFPLRDVEAQWAYQAWELWQGEGAVIGVKTAYVTLTRGLFGLFGSSNTIARMWPALVGSLIIWIPFMFRRKLGEMPALFMSLGLALDPGLVVVSRSVGSPLSSMVFLLIAVGFVAEQKYPWAAASAGFFLLSGHGLAMGMVVFGGVIFLTQVTGVGRWEEVSRDFKDREEYGPRSIPWTRVGLIFAGVVLVLGTYFGKYGQGLTSWLGDVPAYLRGWTEPFPLPAGRFLVVLAAYQPLALIFGVAGGVQGWKEKDVTAQVLGLWFIWALFLVLVYPGRQVWDLVWVIVPLWGLAGMAVADILHEKEVTRVTWILGALFLILSSLLWLSFKGLAVQGGDQRTTLLQWGMILATLGLSGLSIIIVAAEWSWEEAKKGTVMGLVAALGLLMISSLNAAAYVKADDPRQLWLPEPGTGQISLLIETLQEVSVYQTGREDSVEVTVWVEAPSLKWALRNFRDVTYRIDRGSVTDARVILTGEGRAESLQSGEYLGQDFILQSFTAWPGALPEDWKNWLASREGPLEHVDVLLWVNIESYPGGVLFKDVDHGEPSEVNGR